MINAKDTILLPSLVALFTIAMFSNANAEQSFICDSHIENQTIDAEVIIPSGETCEFYEITVNGNITVQRDASFIVLTSSTINGNISANHAAAINITELHLYGNISIADSYNVDIQQATVIFGNALFEKNEFVNLFEQAIFGNTIISQNNYVNVADIGIQGNLIMVKNNLVEANTDPDFYLSVNGNATCQQNEVINGVINVLGRNNGCPLPS